MSRGIKQLIQASIALLMIVSAVFFELTTQGILLVSGSTIHLQYAAGSAKLAGTSDDWTTFQGDLGRSGYNSLETGINAQTASSLKVYWLHQAKAQISSQPVEANGLIYWGSWDGKEHATNLNGNDVWSTYLGKAQNTRCPPPDAGVAGAATVASVLIKGTMTSVVFIAGGTAHFYALDAITGVILWDMSFGNSPNHMIWGGSAVYNGSVYVGISSYGDCPLIQGKLVKLDASTGIVQNTFNVVPPGCVGGGIWNTPTLDVATGTIYVSTGTFHTCNPPETMSNALVALNATDLSVISSWQLPPSKFIDLDFGSTPTLFQATINGSLHQLIGLVNKNGYYYAFDRTNIAGGPLWSAYITERKNIRGKDSISSSAWDGSTLYVGSALTTIKGHQCPGSIRALNPATGSFLWQTCLSGHVLGAVAVVPGVVVTGAGQWIYALSAATGQILFSFEDTHFNPLFWGGPSIANGVLYEGNKDGILFAIRPKTSGTPTPTPTDTPTPTPTPSFIP